MATNIVLFPALFEVGRKHDHYGHHLRHSREQEEEAVPYEGVTCADAAVHGVDGLAKLLLEVLVQGEVVEVQEGHCACPPQEQWQHNDSHIVKEDACVGGHGTDAVQRIRVDIGVGQDLEKRP